MTYNKKIRRFMRLKSSLVESKCDKEMFNASDYMDVERSWTENECKVVFEKLVENIDNKSDSNLDTGVCPYCIKLGPTSESNCINCHYGKIHGVCSSLVRTNSDWGKYFSNVAVSKDEYKSMLKQIEAEEMKEKVMNFDPLNNIFSAVATRINQKKEKEMKLKRIVLEKNSSSDYNITLPKIIEKTPCIESLRWVAEKFPELNMNIVEFYNYLSDSERNVDAKWVKDNFSEYFNENKDEETIHIDDCLDNCIVWGRRVKEYKISINSTTYDTSLYDEDINWIMFVEGGEVTSTIHIKGGGALDKGELSDLMGSCSEYNHYFLIENSEQLKEVVDNHMNWFNK